MKSGYENNKFWVEFESVGYIPPIEKSSFLKDAEILLNNIKGRPAVLFSGGQDSQTLVRCLIDLKADFDCYFWHVPGKTEGDLGRAKHVANAWGLNINVVEVDPLKDRRWYSELMYKIDLPNYYNGLCASLAKEIVGVDCVIQTNSPPFIPWNFNGKFQVFFSPYDHPDPAKRTFDYILGEGKYHVFPYTDHMSAAMLFDECLSHLPSTYDAMTSKFTPEQKYFFWDNFCKTIVYYKAFKDEIFYFPKNDGLENLQWMTKSLPLDHRVYVDYDEMKDFFANQKGSKRFIEV